ncbi:hypothetical protein M430DRAFT_33684 [Amorphotheca resinae ATCC 22711]|uniref:SWIM-type domain-containing protein n=1 Tax=Amorphotheca resinae ATCC 22711 TaxID=857342 RepID=A0A2T3B891_AMORE|nr:hypothetical protein M430DRAFT_33684 [Amorphotheca resinae ATCC 22711]PSS23098.1 hypothetical protein M430DRAFT_33684 [Amorphotheca resinae ATCC 22711]
MSAPISGFSKLSISHILMESSRDQERGEPSGTGKEPAPPDDDGSSLIEHIFALDHCRPHVMQQEGERTPSSPRYAFQIAEAQVKRYGVRISAASPTETTCSCDETGPCRHGRWLLEQLTRTDMSVTEGDSPDLFQYITKRGLENVCEDLFWEFRDGLPESDSEDSEESEESKWELKKKLSPSQLGRQTRRLLRERRNTVRDIMATLSLERTEDYRKDIFESPDDITIADIAMPGDLGGTFSKWFLYDDDAFFRFKPIVSHNKRASAYFRSMDLKAHATCELMDRYAQMGPAPGEIHHDVIWCAQTLADLVNSIGQNIIGRQPLSQSAREEASRALVSILREVVNRNKDVYQDDRLPRRRPHGEPQTNRNLYQRLIGSTSPANPAGPMFVIKELQGLFEAQPFVEDLEEILSKLRTIGWGPAPQAYREKLGTIIAQLKGESGSASPSAEKRPASSVNRRTKRVKGSRRGSED